MGVCLSYTATIIAVKRMGINHDKLVLDWTKSISGSASELQAVMEKNSCDNMAGENADESTGVNDDDNASENTDGNESDIEVIPHAGDDCNLSTDRAIIIIGDNWDKNVKPRDMRENNQVKSLHHFHSVATVSRIETLHMDDKKPLGNVKDIPISDFLPSSEDCNTLCDNYVILIARVITENFKYFSYFRDCVPKHILHEYSSQMAQKTTAVSPSNMQA